jgi:hypothetical protein
MKTETHLKKLKETLEVINECIEKGIDTGFIIKHERPMSKNQVK